MQSFYVLMNTDQQMGDEEDDESNEQGLRRISSIHPPNASNIRTLPRWVLYMHILFVLLAVGTGILADIEAYLYKRDVFFAYFLIVLASAMGISSLTVLIMLFSMYRHLDSSILSQSSQKSCWESCWSLRSDAHPFFRLQVFVGGILLILPFVIFFQVSAAIHILNNAFELRNDRIAPWWCVWRLLLSPCN